MTASFQDILRGKDLMPAHLKRLTEEPATPEAMAWLAEERKRLPAVLKRAQSYGQPDSPVRSREKARDLALRAYYWDRRPLRTMSIQGWVDLFQQVGLVRETGLLPPGVSISLGQKVKVYRGGDRNFPHGLSWTPYFDMALTYALESPHPAIFEIEIKLDQCIHLGYFGGYLQEVIVDSRQYPIKVVTDLTPFIDGSRPVHP